MNVYLDDKKQIKKFLCREPGPRPFIAYKFVDYSKKIVHGFRQKVSGKSTHQLTDTIGCVNFLVVYVVHLIQVFHAEMVTH